MTENFLKLMSETKLQIQKAWRTPSRIKWGKKEKGKNYTQLLKNHASKKRVKYLVLRRGGTPLT